MKNNIISLSQLTASLVILAYLQACSSMPRSSSNFYSEKYSYSGSVSNIADKPTIFNEM